MKNIDKLKERIIETPKYCYLSDRTDHQHVIIWNQMAIMETQIEILKRLEEIKHYD